MPLKNRSWAIVALVGVVALLVGLLAAQVQAPPAHAQASEGRAKGLIAVTSSSGGESLLYLVDTNREVILVYGFHQPGSRSRGDLRTGVFEFLAGRLYRWDALLCSRTEYSLKGIESLRGLRVRGEGGAQDQYEKANR